MTGGRDAWCLAWLCLTAFLRTSLRRATAWRCEGEGNEDLRCLAIGAGHCASIRRDVMDFRWRSRRPYLALAADLSITSFSNHAYRAENCGKFVYVWFARDREQSILFTDAAQSKNNIFIFGKMYFKIELKLNIKKIKVIKLQVTRQNAQRKPLLFLFVTI